MPGEHHFYVSFRTDQTGVTIPARLLAQYPEEMTIVLQHQFWDLKVDEARAGSASGLSFGGIASTLVIPFAALTAFADPHAQFGLRFRAPRWRHARRRRRRRRTSRTRPAGPGERSRRSSAWTHSANAGTDGGTHGQPAASPPGFTYAPMFPVGERDTPWRRLDLPGVSTATCDGQPCCASRRRR